MPLDFPTQKNRWPNLTGSTLGINPVSLFHVQADAARGGRPPKCFAGLQTKEASLALECPLSTSDGVEAIDVAWLRPGRGQELRSATCLVRTPEICVEVLSPSNAMTEIGEKIVLYFEAGVREVWTCNQDGILEFHLFDTPEIRQTSEICPGFPLAINFSDD
jgi:hypothetical protein